MPRRADGWSHLDPVIDVFERARHGGVRSIITLPPRHRKTTTALNGLAWLLKNEPALEHAYVTYNDIKSKKESRRLRRIARRAGVDLDPKISALGEWKTMLGGGMRFTSIEGGLTGEGVTGVLVIDDPIKDRKEADSDGRREDIWEWFTDVAFTRMEPGSSIIVILTRWHEDDLAGRLIAGEFNKVLEDAGEAPWDWEVVKLAGLCVDEKDGTGRKRGEALWPEMYPARRLRVAKALNPWSFEALYQQNPTPRFAQLFKRDPARYKMTEFLERGLEGYRLLIGMDPAASDSTKADHWGGVLLAVKGWQDQMRGWVLDVLHEQCDPIDGAQKTRDFQIAWGDIELAIEGGVVGKSPIASLRRQHKEIRIIEVTPDRDKYSAAQPFAAAWNRGDILVPLDAPWAHKFIQQCRKFTGKDGGDDDLVDGARLAWNELADVEEWDPLDGLDEFETHMPGYG